MKAFVTFACFFWCATVVGSMQVAFAADEISDTAIYLPSDYHSRVSWPLVVLLHGSGATGDMQDIHLGISERTSTAGMVLAVPEARSGSVNFDRKADLLALISELKARYAVDPKRVFIIGHSMGGYQALSFACEHGDQVAGIVVSAAAGVCTDGKVPVSLLLATGDSDISDLNVSLTMASWRKTSGCGMTSKITSGLDLHWDVAGAESTLTQYQDCRDGRTVASLRSKHGRHVPIFKALFSNLVLEFIQTGGTLSAEPSSDVVTACQPERDDRGRFISETISFTPKMTKLRVEEFSDSQCTNLMSRVEYSGPAVQSTQGVFPLRFDTVELTPISQSVVSDLNGQAEEHVYQNAGALCDREWASGQGVVVSGRDGQLRKKCVYSVGNISGPASFAKKLMLSYLFAPAL